MWHSEQAAKELLLAVHELKQAREHILKAEQALEADDWAAMHYAGRVYEAYSEVCDLQTRLGRIRKEVK